MGSAGSLPTKKSSKKKAKGKKQEAS
jgi:hypothetical protein